MPIWSKGGIAGPSTLLNTCKRCQPCCTSSQRSFSQSQPVYNPPRTFRRPILKTRPGLVSLTGDNTITKPSSPQTPNHNPNNTLNDYKGSSTRNTLPRSTFGLQNTSLSPSAGSTKPILSPIAISQNVASSNLAQIPPRTSKRIKVGFSGIDLGTILPSHNSRRLPSYTCPLFTLSACPTHLLPSQRPPPFPPQYLQERTDEKIIKFGIVTSKAAISKLATERNLARRRMRAAVDVVLNRGVGLGGEDEGIERVLDKYTYLARLRGEMVNVEFEQIVVHTARAFEEIRKAVEGGVDLTRKKFR